FPPRLPSITPPLLRPDTKVWPAADCWGAAARRQVVTSPLYSMSCSPAASDRNANSPLPCTGDRRDVIHRSCIELPFIAKTSLLTMSVQRRSISPPRIFNEPVRRLRATNGHPRNPL